MKCNKVNYYQKRLKSPLQVYPWKIRQQLRMLKYSGTYSNRSFVYPPGPS